MFGTVGLRPPQESPVTPQIFAAPTELLWGLAVLGVALLFLRARRTTRAQVRELLGSRSDELVQGREGSSAAPLLRCAAAALLVLALAEPQLGLSEDLEEQSAAELIICLDVSRSMLAADVPGDRLSLARSALQTMLSSTEKLHAGLVLFAGEPHLRAPLTRDLAAIHALLADTDPWSVEHGGTTPRAALELALATASAGRGTHAAILYLSDGERALAAAPVAASARERGIRVHTAVVGGSRSVKIPLPSVDGSSAFVRSSAGEDVLTRADPLAMQQLADAGGGVAVHLHADANTLSTLVREEVLPLARAGVRAERAAYASRAAWPLAAALLALLALVWPKRSLRT